MVFLKVFCAWMNGNKLAKALAVSQQKVRVGIWCEVRHSSIYLTDCEVKPQENAFAVFFLPSRDYTERRMKSSAPALPLKPLPSSSARVSKHTLCLLASTRLDPVAPKLFYSLYFLRFVKIISCESSQLWIRRNFAPRRPNIRSYVRIFSLTSCICTSKAPPQCLLRACPSPRINHALTSQRFFCSLLVSAASSHTAVAVWQVNPCEHDVILSPMLQVSKKEIFC